MAFGDVVALRLYAPPTQFRANGSLLLQSTTAAGTYPVTGNAGIIDGQPIIEANQLFVAARLFVRVGGTGGTFTVELYYLPPAGAWTQLAIAPALSVTGAAGPPTNQEAFTGANPAIALPRYSRIGCICTVNSLTGAPFDAMINLVWG